MRRLLEGDVFFDEWETVRFFQAIEFTIGHLFFLEHLSVVVPVCVCYLK